MKPNQLKHCFRLLLCLLILFAGYKVDAANNSTLNGLRVSFTKKELTFKAALEELDKIPEITVVYGKIDKCLKQKVVFSSKDLSVQEAITEIEQAIPVKLLFNNNHIIVKEKEQPDSYLLYGVVKDAANLEHLAAASIYIEGTNKGIVANSDGEFNLKLEPGSYRLTCRFIGYEEETIDLNLFRDQDIEFLLKVKNHSINEVKINGAYSELEILEKGRPIETIESKIINKLNTNDVNDALHGRLNGVWTTKVSGAPGDHHRIRIRGINSIFGCADPLYVVDGSIVPIVNFDNIGISDLNSHDVEKITVLKDAASTALYGNLGSNGVILIETKKGGGETQWEFGVKSGVQAFNKRYDLMDAETFFNTLQLSDDINKTDFYKVIPDIHYEEYPTYFDSLGNTLAETDFQDDIFNTGIIQEYQLSGKGRLKDIDYYVSGNYYNHKGVVVNSNYNKYTLTANLSKVIDDKLSVRLLYKGSHQENLNTLDNFLGNDVIFKGINYEPAYYATPDSFLNKIGRLYYNNIANTSVATLANHKKSPNELFNESDKIKIENANSLNLQGFYKLNKNLSFKSLMSISIRNAIFTSNLQKSYNNYDHPEAYYKEEYQSDFGMGHQLKSDESYVYFCQHYDIVYSKQHNGHLFDVLFRYRNYQDNAYWMVDSISNVYYDQIRPTDNVFLRGSQALYGERGSVRRSVHSGIVNVNYNYKKKYFASLITNLEALKENEYHKKADLFYSLALNWDLAKEESFHFPNWVDEFNFNLNIGKAGNYPLNSLADDLFNFSGKYVANDELVNAVYISNLANSALKQEGVIEKNAGTQLSLFDERFRFSADFYLKHYSNLLVNRSIPYYYGGGVIYDNIGEMENRGVELSLDIVPIETKNFYWNSKIGFSTNRQMITKLVDSTTINFNNTDILIPDFVAAKNEVLGAIYGYKYMGRSEDFEQIQVSNPTDRFINTSGLVYMKLDTLYSKKITEDDKTVIGNSIPDFTFNWINTFEYKNFSMEMMWYGAIGLDKYNATKASTYISGVNTEVRNMILDSLKFNVTPIFYESSFFVEDASFIRLKTLTFNYRPVRKIASKVGVEFSLSFENLIILTNYTGYDPEATIYTQNNFSDNAIDKGSYPNPKGVYFSINLIY